MKGSRFRQKGLFKISKEDKARIEKDKIRKRVLRLHNKEKLLKKRLNKAAKRIQDFDLETKKIEEIMKSQ